MRWIGGLLGAMAAVLVVALSVETVAGFAQSRWSRMEFARGWIAGNAAPERDIAGDGRIDGEGGVAIATGVVADDDALVGTEDFEGWDNLGEQAEFVDPEFKADITLLFPPDYLSSLEGASLAFEERTEAWNFERDIVEFEIPENYVRVLPEGMNLIVAESVNYRLTEGDIEGLPREVNIAIWPDSPIVQMRSQYYLINPPTERMEYYYVQAVTQDDNDFYVHAMKNAKGVFVRHDDELLSDTPMGLLFLHAMADQNKSLVADIEALPEGVDVELARDKIAFYKVDRTIGSGDFEADWKEAEDATRHGEELNLVIEASDSNMAQLRDILQTQEKEIRAYVQSEAEGDAVGEVVIEEEILPQEEGVPSAEE